MLAGVIAARLDPDQPSAAATAAAFRRDAVH
jgi:hypothetical protein